MHGFPPLGAVWPQRARAYHAAAVSSRRVLLPLLTVLVLATAPTAAQNRSPGPEASRSPCVADSEPNDTPETGSVFAGPGCIEGTLPDSDQDIYLWTITAAQATQPWDITMAGVQGAITGAKVFPITSDEGVSPMVVGAQILEVAQTVEDLGAVTTSGVLLPVGRYLLGVSRSTTEDGGTPVDVSYRVDVTAGTPLPPSGEVEPNEDPTTATGLQDSFLIGGDLLDSRDTFRWTTGELPVDQGWDVELAGPRSASLQLTLEDADGLVIAVAYVDAQGRTGLKDLQLPAGEHLLVVDWSAAVTTPYALSAQPAAMSGADPEPNSDVAQAVPIDPARPVVKGRLAAGDVHDWYSFDVSDAVSGVLLDVRLIWRSGPSRRLCLNDAEGHELQCRDGPDGVALSGLHLPPGIVTLSVNGDPADDATYLLRIDSTTVPATDFEYEPNDTPLTASPVIGDTVSGQLAARDDRDTFRVTTTGEPQLWQVDVTGTGIAELLWEKLDGTQLGVGDVSPAHDSAVLTDAYLIPGDHWLRIAGADGDYTMSLTPLGPPDPNGEREPNNAALDAEPLPIGVERSGRLPSLQDADVFRFTLATADHVRVTVTPPPDGAVDMRLESGNLRYGDIDGHLGAPTTYDALLQPGDYELWLTDTQASTSRYSVIVERGDPFALAVDQEPNDDVAHANPLPRSLHIEGGGPDGDRDWYSLGVLPTGGDMTVRTKGVLYRVAVSDGTTEYTGVPDDSGGYLMSGVPGGVPLWLGISTQGPYVVDVIPGTTGLAEPLPDPEALPVTLELVPEVAQVAAYWPAGQMVGATLKVTNTGTDAQDLRLDWAASSAHWGLDLDHTEVSVDPGDTATIPATLRVLPDAAIDDGVRMTVRGRDATGAQATGSTTLRAGPDVAPVAPYQAWTVPDALLGGLDVASAALGGVPVVSIDPEAEAQLYDGVTSSGRGFRTQISGSPVAVTVDLAGEQPIPVAGMILDPLGSRLSIEPGPRAVTLLLSDDGVTWQEVLSTELSPRTTDQAFVLPQPIPARFAQLRIDSTWAGTTGDVVLGEWKVVAQPGVVPDQMPTNIADPIRGGHVVWMQPQASSQDEADRLLTDDPAEYPARPSAKSGDVPVAVIGFHADREALLTSLEWLDPVDTDPTLRIRHVDVDISTAGPVGPWVPVGGWDLKRAGDGSVNPFTFDSPTWVRFIRLTGRPVGKNDYYVEWPATIRALEMATAPAYRSILGEWGQDDPTGPRQWTEPPDEVAVADEQVSDDTPETAQPLRSGDQATGRVHRDQDVDWYSVTIPAGKNSLAITVGGVPAVGVSLTLFDEAGQTVPMTFGPGDEGTVSYAANVTSGATYRIRVTQPPFSAVFTFDTSGSMGSYLPFVTEALRAYTAGVTKGEEAVKVTPFEEDPLLNDWADDPYLLQDAVDRYVLGEGSSGAEAALIDASGELAGREGARAVLLVTDAETSSYAKGQELWADLERVQPTVFSVHVGGDSVPDEARHFMQDWAAARGGSYQYAVSHGEMDRAFDRMATWLRRPAAYTLDMATSEEEIPPPPPGTLSVVAVGPAGEPARAPASKDVAVDIILDTSGSMLDRFGGKSRIESAKAVLDDLVTGQLPAGAPVAVRVLGSRDEPCGTRVAVPFGPLDASVVTDLVDRLRVDRAADTPIGQAFDAVPEDLATATGARIVLLITDSKEIWPHRDLCGQDPLDAIRDLQRQGIDARINIVGMAVDDRRARRQMARWAKVGGGAYFDARDRRQLDDAIRQAVSAPYQVFDQAGKLAGNGTVGGKPINLPPGTYRVVVLSEPPATYPGIVVETGGSVTVTLPSTEPRKVSTPTPEGSPGPDESAAPGEPAAP